MTRARVRLKAGKSVGGLAMANKEPEKLEAFDDCCANENVSKMITCAFRGHTLWGRRCAKFFVPRFNVLSLI